MDIDANFAELFGSNSVADSLGNPMDYRTAQPVPILDTPQPLRDFGKAGAASELCHALETETMIDTLVGPTRDISQPPTTPAAPAPAPGSAAFGEFIKTWTDRAPVPVAKASGHWQSNKHEAAVRAIVDKAKNCARSTDPASSALWDKLICDTVDLLCNTEHAACGGS